MQTKEIQQDEWRAFFDNFSRTHQGAVVDLEIIGPDIGAQTEEKGLTLIGITAESDERLGNTIIIMVGANANGHITHSIRFTKRVSIGQTDDGADFALAIYGADGSTALLRLQLAELPEEVDAVAS
ncbi:MAG TPA: DUF5335 family protein [Pyrinomonadaceae bacterium]